LVKNRRAKNDDSDRLESRASKKGLLRKIKGEWVGIKAFLLWGFGFPVTNRRISRGTFSSVWVALARVSVRLFPGRL